MASGNALLFFLLLQGLPPFRCHLGLPIIGYNIIGNKLNMKSGRKCNTKNVFTKLTWKSENVITAGPASPASPLGPR